MTANQRLKEANADDSDSTKRRLIASHKADLIGVATTDSIGGKVDSLRDP
jgi:hypothetical protein